MEFDNNYQVGDYSLQCTPPEVNEVASRPTKSREVYKAAYLRFLKWCGGRNVANYSEFVLMAYFSYLATTLNMKSSSLWSHYSMLKNMLNVKHGLDISRYLKLRAYLKKKNEGYLPKKSKVFTKAEFEKFLFEADDDQYLAYKIILLIGISGACKCDEMVRMKTTDIEDFDTLLYIKVVESKTNKIRSFTIEGEPFIKIYKKYASLRPRDMTNQRFFLKYAKGKCARSAMGIHKIGSIPREVASYLKLPNPEEYTGHSLWRTSPSLLINAGANITGLQGHSVWGSGSMMDAVSSGQIVNSSGYEFDVSSNTPEIEENWQTSLRSTGICFQNANMNDSSLYQRKWKGLRDSYTRERAKQKKESGSATAKFRKKYKYFDQLRFLETGLRPTEDNNALSDEDQIPVEDIKIEQDVSNPDPELENFEDEPSNQKRKRNEGQDEDFLETLRAKYCKQEDGTHVDDDDKLFLLSLHNDLKTLPDYIKLSVKSQIVGILSIAKQAAYPPKTCFQEFPSSSIQYQSPRYKESDNQQVNDSANPSVLSPADGVSNSSNISNELFS